MTDQFTSRGPIASATATPARGVRIPRPAPSMRPAWSTAARACPRVVLVLRGRERPTQSLLAAVSLARSLDARLHVLAVVPGPTALERVLRDDVAGGRRAVEQTRDTRKALDSWLGEMLDTPRAIEQVAVRHGDFVTQAAVYAAALPTKLILVASQDERCGEKVTALSVAAATPVLLLRGARGHRTILAATDLLNTQYPVLTHAAELARRLNGSVVALHNVRPEPVAGAELALFGCSHSQPNLEQKRAERLAEVARHLPVATQAVVRSEHSSAHAVVNEAKARAADLVVVGTRHRRWSDRFWLGHSVSARVVSRADCSVLVLPLAARAPGSVQA